MNKRYLSPRELAEVFGVAPDTILDWTHRGILHPLRPSRRTFRYDLDDARRALEQNAAQLAAKPCPAGDGGNIEP